MSAFALVKSGEYIGARELRERLSHVIKSNKPFFVTDHGKPVKVMVPYAAFLELLEMVEELKDHALLREVARGRVEYARGTWKAVPWPNLFGERG